MSQPQPITPEDPRLTAYALGQLEGAERDAVAAAIAADPQLQRQAEAVAAQAGQVQGAYAQFGHADASANLLAAVNRRLDEEAALLRLEQGRQAADWKNLKLPPRRPYLWWTPYVLPAAATFVALLSVAAVWWSMAREPYLPGAGVVGSAAVSAATPAADSAVFAQARQAPLRERSAYASGDAAAEMVAATGADADVSGGFGGSGGASAKSMPVPEHAAVAATATTATTANAAATMAAPVNAIAVAAGGAAVVSALPPLAAPNLFAARRWSAADSATAAGGAGSGDRDVLLIAQTKPGAHAQAEQPALGDASEQIRAAAVQTAAIAALAGGPDAVVASAAGASATPVVAAAPAPVGRVAAKASATKGSAANVSSPVAASVASSVAAPTVAPAQAETAGVPRARAAAVVAASGEWRRAAGHPRSDERQAGAGRVDDSASAAVGAFTDAGQIVREAEALVQPVAVVAEVPPVPQLETLTIPARPPLPLPEGGAAGGAVLSGPADNFDALMDAAAAVMEQRLRQPRIQAAVPASPALVPQRLDLSNAYVQLALWIEAGQLPPPKQVDVQAVTQAVKALASADAQAGAAVENAAALEKAVQSYAEVLHERPADASARLDTIAASLGTDQRLLGDPQVSRFLSLLRETQKLLGRN